MGPLVKRVTAGIYATFTEAFHVEQFLLKAGFRDVKIVSKHAVQVHPSEQERLNELLLQQEIKNAN